MREAQPVGEVLSPVITPFGADLVPDGPRLAAHCRWLLANDVGLALFGTNSEGNSLALADKQMLLDTLVADGLPTERMMPSTGVCSIEETVTLTKHALDTGCTRVLMLPPFYYKGVSEEGLFRYYSEVIERVGDGRLRLYLYHIPAVTKVPLRPALIGRLFKAYPDTLAGIKDSSGDWSNTQTLIDTFSADGFQVFPGSERFLLDAMRAGGAGCISATANVNPAAIAQLARTWRTADADAQQAALIQVRDVFESVPTIPALKATTAHFSGDSLWATVRPPLVELDPTNYANLMDSLTLIDFSMPGLTTA